MHIHESQCQRPFSSCTCIALRSSSIGQFICCVVYMGRAPAVAAPWGPALARAGGGPGPVFVAGGLSWAREGGVVKGTPGGCARAARGGGQTEPMPQLFDTRR